MNILAPLQPNPSSLSKTTLRQMNQIIIAMLSMTGRITILGLSRWAGEGSSYRTIQRFYYTAIPWAQVFWQFFSQCLFQKEEVYILAGDECVVSKAGKKAYGLDHFFSGLQQMVIPSLSFFVLSLVSVKQRRSYPIYMEQTIRSPEEKASSKAKKEAKRVEPKRKRGRPKGSKNKPKVEVALNPELLRIQKMLKALLFQISSVLQPVYLALDGHFGNYPAFQMVRQCGIHLISKLRWDAALCLPYEGPYAGSGPHCKYGERLNYRNIPEKYLKTTCIEDGIQTRTYQAQLLHADFPLPLNVVIIVKTNLTTQAWAHVILFSSDPELPFDKLVDYYSLRFQIEFNFRDAKQFWGLEDFMNVNQIAVTNAANLSLFMVNLSQLLMCDFRQTDPNFGVLDLKSYYRGHKYASEMLKMLPQKPDDILIAQLFHKVATLGSIHVAKSPVCLT
ncbi:MAG: transposase [Anaerolineaceae bacterium]|nr:transposase [Anaerolineaceae bacterium]